MHKLTSGVCVCVCVCAQTAKTVEEEAEAKALGFKSSAALADHLYRVLTKGDSW